MKWWKQNFFNISASIEINSALGIFHLLYVIFESIKISSKKILPRNLLILRRHWIDEKCVSWCLTDNATQWMMMSHFRFFLLSSDRFIDDDDDLSLASCSILKMNFCDSLNDDIEWQKIYISEGGDGWEIKGWFCFLFFILLLFEKLQIYWLQFFLLSNKWNNNDSRLIWLSLSLSLLTQALPFLVPLSDF